jgi:hypothetical protein
MRILRAAVVSAKLILHGRSGNETAVNEAVRYRWDESGGIRKF